MGGLEMTGAVRGGAGAEARTGREVETGAGVAAVAGAG